MLTRIFAFLKEMYKRFNANQVADLSAQCAYYFLLSLFPFLLFAITVLSYLPITSDDVLRVLATIAPEMSNDIIRNNIHEVLSVKRTGLMSFGILFTAWSALFGIESLVRALNLSYGIKEQRGFFWSKLLSLILMAGMIAGIVSAFVFTIFGAAIGSVMEEYYHLPAQLIAVWNSLRLAVNLVFLNLIFLGLYMVAPKKRVGIREALPGTLFASFGWHYTSLGFSYYVDNFANFSATYGSLGAIIVLMVWFYLSAMILILGGQINAVLMNLGLWGKRV